ncbi:hypothetical protein T03_8051 [Trichinella britovi]|uniref:Uncharacterized protein n=1 Tax=Trichinella britovi TaxID=45882 RepID=A0A0V1D844_TRIBR|nr:hypothetical protein T03_8051 [Trichinella britovi]
MARLEYKVAFHYKFPFESTRLHPQPAWWSRLNNITITSAHTATINKNENRKNKQILSHTNTYMFVFTTLLSSLVALFRSPCGQCYHHLMAIGCLVEEMGHFLHCQWLTDRPRGTIWCPAVISKAGGDLVNEHSNNDDQTASSFLHNSTNKANSVHTRCDSSNSPACRVQSAWTPVNRADHPKLAPVAIGTLRRSIIIRPFSTFPHRTTQYKPPYLSWILNKGIKTRKTK